MIDARTALGKMFSTILGRKGLALHGSANDERSNLVQILKARSEDVSQLDSWLKRQKSTWLTHDVTNEILERMADKVLRQKVDQIKSAGSFSLIMDETSDVSRFEQVSMRMRIVLENLTVRDIFIGFYKIEDPKSEALLKITQNVFVRYGLTFNGLMGQFYNGISYKHGKIADLRSRVFGKASRTLYVHWSAHTLNLVVGILLEDLPCARFFVGLVKDLVNFIRDSPKRLAQFENFESAAGSNLTSYCPTRWCMSVKTLVTLRTKENYSAALEFFESMMNDKEIDSVASVKAAGFLERINSVEFFFLLNVTIDIFDFIEKSSADLQKHELCMNKSRRIVNTVTKNLRVKRDSTFDFTWSQIIPSPKELGIREPHSQHPRKRYWSNASSVSAGQTFHSPKDYYRNVYYTIFDTVLSSLTVRSQNYMMSVLSTRETFVIGQKVDVKTLTHSYNRQFKNEDFIPNSVRLNLHRDMFLDLLAQRKIRVHSIKDVVYFLKKNADIRELVSELGEFIKSLLVVPVSPYTCETSFFTLKRLKNYLSSTKQ